MADIDKVEKGVKACWSEYFFHRCFDCPYKPDRDDSKCVERLGADVLELLKEQQAEIKRLKAEQPKIIRCKDCKYGVKHELNLSNMYECGYPFTIVQEGHFGDFFCAMAEPKAGEQNG